MVIDSCDKKQLEKHFPGLQEWWENYKSIQRMERKEKRDLKFQLVITKTERKEMDEDQAKSTSIYGREIYDPHRKY